ncbi:MAG: hypothetical protein AB8B56_20100 [Crocinitomicaceae bacterium]
MKVLTLFLLLTISAHSEIYAQSQFKLDPSQSMLMTGKGAGQDGARNPYSGKDCAAVVQNLKESTFSIRIQQDGELVKVIQVESKETVMVFLPKGHELYIDTNTNEEVNFDLTFEKASNYIDG